MGSVQVKELSIKHEGILHFMVMNPSVPQWEVAQRFGVSESWLSTLSNSEAFKEAREQLTQEVIQQTVLPMRRKLVGLADKALDRMEELIPYETDLDRVRKTADSVLEACGFTAKKQPAVGQQNTQNNYYLGNASAEVLARARERIGRGALLEDLNDRTAVDGVEAIPMDDPSGEREAGGSATLEGENGGGTVAADPSVSGGYLGSGSEVHAGSGGRGGPSGDSQGTPRRAEESGFARTVGEGADNTGREKGYTEPAGAGLLDGGNTAEYAEQPGRRVAITVHGADW